MIILTVGIRMVETIKYGSGSEEVGVVLDEEKWNLYQGLYEGLRDNRDPVTVRTFLVDMGKILGVEIPEWEEVPEEKWSEARLLVNKLIENTILEVLEPELLDSLGIELSEEEINSLKPIELLVANGRHLAEPLWGGLIGCVAEKIEGGVGGFNPVGHYNDGQSRIAGIRRMLRRVDKFVVIGSTQEDKGGNLAVLSHVTRLIRNKDFGTKIGEVFVAIPMFGGSRGHRSGQREGMLFEVLETISDPKIIALPLIDAWQCLEEDLIRDARKKGELTEEIMNEIGLMMPDLKVVTVDIHNDVLPARKFTEKGIEFINADPTPETAQAAWIKIKEQGLEDKTQVIMASDEGAIPRTDNFAVEFFNASGKDVIYVGNLIKTRLVAGNIDNIEMGKLERWSVVDGEIIKEELFENEISNLFKKETVLTKSDDMIDTGGTNIIDEEFLRERMNIIYSLTVASHPVFSKGSDIIDYIGSDVYLTTNTLLHNGLSGREDVTIVDASPAIARALEFA